MKKHIDDHIKVLEEIINFYYNRGAQTYGNKDSFVKERINTLVRSCLNVIWKMDSATEAKKKMKRIDFILKKKYPYTIPYMGKEVLLIRRTGYLLFRVIWNDFHRKNKVL